jgi:uncharacterized phage protein (TIGR01671 family)
MSREIKFKAWDKSQNQMITSVAIYGVWEQFVTSFDRDYIHNSQDWNGIEGFSYDYELLQFTGLKDKNGKEIYDGDIVKCLLATEPEDKGFICKFKDYRWKFNNVRYPDDDFYGTVNYNYIQQNCEVIGNIYENPELLSERS